MAEREVAPALPRSLRSATFVRPCTAGFSPSIELSRVRTLPRLTLKRGLKSPFSKLNGGERGRSALPCALTTPAHPCALGFSLFQTIEGSNSHLNILRKQAQQACFLKMAEREGFEPSMELLTPYSLSRGAPSASRPSLQ